MQHNLTERLQHVKCDIPIQFDEKKTPIAIATTGMRAVGKYVERASNCV